MAASRQALSDCGIRTCVACRRRAGGGAAVCTRRTTCAYLLTYYFILGLFRCLLFVMLAYMLALRVMLLTRDACSRAESRYHDPQHRRRAPCAALLARSKRAPPAAPRELSSGPPYTTPWCCSARLPRSLGLSPPTALALQHHDDGVSHLLGHILYGFAFGALAPSLLALGVGPAAALRPLRPLAPGGGALVYLLA